MLPNTAIVVADAHLTAQRDDAVSSAFQRFLREVPKLGQHLVINGDLFEFWFEYRSVIPRAVFPVLAELWNVVRHGVRVTVTGGNHDRWGGPFWEEQMGAEYHPQSVELDVAGWRTWLGHGDGNIETEFLSKAVHRVIGHPLTSMTFRALHPDLGFWLVRKSSRVLGRRKDDVADQQDAADVQARAARALLERRTDLDLVILGHTHRATVEEVGVKRWYLNPGAWMDGYEYAMVTDSGPELRRFE
jgi:UDP-2,3-diacylglucosamine hydrolase